MKTAEFTDDIGAEIIALMQKPPTKKPNCCAAVLRTHYSVDRLGVWENRWEACYAPTARKLESPDHPDHFGIPFFGQGVGDDQANAEPSEEPYNEAAICFLTALMDRAGAFRKILPSLWHKTPEEVLQDRGFVVINGLSPECNPALVWTFLQAARMIYEHKPVLPLFTKALTHTKDTQVALFCALSLWPTPDNRFTNARPNLHGDALGSTMTNPYRLRQPFLTGVTTKPANARHHPYGSHMCFPTTEMPVRYNINETVHPLSKWVKLYEEIRAKAA